MKTEVFIVELVSEPASVVAVDELPGIDRRTDTNGQFLAVNVRKSR